MTHTMPLILNVDDYEPTRYSRSRALMAAGFAVREATTGVEALTAVVRDQPAIVLLDVNLPDMSGLEVCRRLRNDPLTASVPVLHVSSTFVSDPEKIRGLESGADGYLTEPVEPAVLVAWVNAVLRARQAEEALRASVQQWQATFGAISDGVALVTEDGTVTRCNEAFLRLVDPAGVVGRKIWQVWAEQSPDSYPLPFLRMRRSRQREIGDLRHGDRWLHLVVDPVLDEQGELLGGVYIVSNVTEQKRIEEERTRLLALEQAARADAEAANRAKDDFLAVLSHELRTPLSTMLGWIRLLRGGTLDEAGATRALETIERNIDLQTRLIGDLLDVSAIVSGKLRLDMEPVPLASVIAAATEAVRPAVEAKGLALHCALDAVSGVVGDPARLQQVVWNLLSNAVKFTPRGGRIDVQLQAEGRDAVITVADTGQGIAPEFLPYVFDRFRQAETSSARAHGGLGLGLAIVRHVVERHGGSVRADSAGTGRGASFTVRLPISTEPEPDHGRRRGEEPRLRMPDLHGVQVLVVDDETDVHTLLQTLLEGCGATVVAVTTAAQALERLSGPVRADVVVSDIGMPGEDGYDLIRRLRARPDPEVRSIPTIALTAYARPEDRDRALASGYDHHLAKPLDPARVAQAIAELLGRA